ncbi:unnamed protein product [Phyllotreta striolata]|uniref:Uncharacterized protein n=1 Tax=Phyllotreta striolata TaxID=444603 RepID=A0A9N9T9I2_PHYSR|nr:unnamed protein product [Phyllotreta striolata]
MQNRDIGQKTHQSSKLSKRSGHLLILAHVSSKLNHQIISGARIERVRLKPVITGNMMCQKIQELEAPAENRNYAMVGVVKTRLWGC